MHAYPKRIVHHIRIKKFLQLEPVYLENESKDFGPMLQRREGY